MLTKEKIIVAKGSVGDDVNNENEASLDEAAQREENNTIGTIKTTITESVEESSKHPDSSPKKDGRETKAEGLDTVDNLRAEIKTLKEFNEELKRELEEKIQESYTIKCIIRSVNIENEKLLDQVENLENELQNVLSEKEGIELELNRRRGEEGRPAMEELFAELYSLKRHNEQLKVQLEESNMQRKNMDCIVEQLNVGNEKHLENIDGLEKAVSEKQTAELDSEELLQKAKEENGNLHNHLRDIETEIESSNEAEKIVIATELEQLKDLHAKISEIHAELCGKNKAVLEKSAVKTNASQSTLSLLQELRVVMLSVVQISDDFKNTMLEGLEDTEKHKTALEIELTHVKGEYIKILDQITVLTEHNEELKIQLEEGDKQRSKMDCVVESVNVENEKLLERIHDLENELKTALDEKNDIEKQLKKKNTNEECMENELSNLRDNLRLKTFAQEEMDSAIDRVCNDKQKLEEELGLMRISLEENEKAKLELAKGVNSMALQLEKLKNKQSSWNKTVDYAHLREQVEHLKGLLSLSEQNETILKKEVESVLARASPISSDADFTQHKEQHKIRIEEQLDELEGEITIILQELSRPFQLKEIAAFRNLEKQIKTIRDEICQFRNERIHTLRKENGGKRTYRKLKKRLICSDADLKSLKQSLQRDLQDKKEMDDEFRRQIQNDIKQVRCLLKHTTDW